LKVATPSTLTGSFASTSAWVPVLEQAIGKPVRVIPEDSEAVRYMRFSEGEFHLDSVSISDTQFAMMGESAYAEKKGHAVRVIWHHNDTPWGLVVRGDSEFQTIYDIKKPGVRMAVNTAAPTMVISSHVAYPAFLGWTEEEAAANWTFVPKGSYAENCRSVTDGSADVSMVSPISSVTVEMEAHPKGLRWLTMPASDTEGWARYLAYRPTHLPSLMTWGVPSAIGIESYVANFIYWVLPEQCGSYRADG